MAFGTFTETKSTQDTSHFAALAGFDIVSGYVDLSASYTTNGEAVTAVTFGGTSSQSIKSMVCGVSTDGSVLASYDSANGKIQAYNTNGAAEVTATTNLTAAGKEFYVTVIIA